MHSSLYAKFLGKALLLEQAKLVLADAWRGFVAFSVANIPNGYYFIHCETEEMQNRLLWDGPSLVAGRILQLSLWKESFQPTFERFSTVAVWVQIYHLPMELWGGDILELVDDHGQANLLLGKAESHSLELQRSRPPLSHNDPSSSTKPLLISSVSFPSSEQRETSLDRHTMAVDQVTGALVCSPTEEQNMSASSFDDIRSVQEVEDEMILS